jgi:hypothetical protein
MIYLRDEDDLEFDREEFRNLKKEINTWSWIDYSGS